MIEPTDEPQQEPYGASIDMTVDSARLVGNGERVKCICIMDVTELSEEQRKLFVNRSLAALTRMGNKLPKEKE